MPWIIEPITKRHLLEGFDCGIEPLNAYLARYARWNDRQDVGRTYVAVEPAALNVRGFMTLAAGAVRFEHLTEAMQKRLPKYPVPSVHLARLAVQNSAKGRGLGEALLIEAMRIAALVSTQIGVRIVDVIAFNENARAFYARYGFVSLADDPSHLVLPIETTRIVAQAAKRP